MKKILTLIILSLLAVTSVVAPQPDNGIGSIDDECQDFDFDFGVAKWQCEEDGYYPQIMGEVSVQDAGPMYWWLEEGDDDTSVTGTCSLAYWDVDGSDATGIVVKGGHVGAGGYHYSVRGTSGTVEESQPEISHITFCGDEDDEIPEFTVIGAVAVLGLAGLFVARRRD